ncbi:MAG TPA: response regulator transcription factor [Spirochaetia bacterium]|nr:response regulator transcription factor [Spirochaetia bacterium]
MKPNSSVLVIDDEPQIRHLLQITLVKHGYTVHEAATAEDGLQMAARKKPDIVLLDLGLPDRDGAEALAELRTWSAVPVIILSVRNAEEEIVRLLEAGADDYLVKPFNTRELMARMNVIIRNRQPQEPHSSFVSGRLRVDLFNREVSVAGEPVKLTPTEYGLIRMLVQNAGHVVTHGQLLREVWGPHLQKETNYVHVYITGLRKKIEKNPQMPDLILTQPGVGYRLMVLPEADRSKETG